MTNAQLNEQTIDRLFELANGHGEMPINFFTPATMATVLNEVAQEDAQLEGTTPIENLQAYEILTDDLKLDGDHFIATSQDNVLYQANNTIGDLLEFNLELLLYFPNNAKLQDQIHAVIDQWQTQRTDGE